jgi:hypothetical protein
MRRFVSALFVFLLVALVASACGGSAGLDQPGQDTPIPATNTPAPKAGTPRPPTQTPVPGGPIAGKKVLANGVWTCPLNTAGAQYVGSLQGNEYHRLDCSTAQEIPAQDRVCFLDHQVALKFGYVPAKDCSPP